MFKKRDKQTTKRKTLMQTLGSERGNVFFTLFGAVAIVGVLGASTMMLMRGPLSTAVNVNREQTVNSDLTINARIVALNVPDNGVDPDGCDTDITVEAIDPINPASGPAGGGLLPTGMGATLTDPWGTPYGYCSWDHGAENTGCGNALAGELDANDAIFVYAIISAGPDRAFDTTCSDAAPGGYLAGFNKGAGDDIAKPITFEGAFEVSGGSSLWTLDDPNNELETTRGIDVGGEAKFAGNVDLSGNATSQLKLGAASLVLPTQADLGICNAGNHLLPRINTAGTQPVMEICDNGNGFIPASGLWRLSGSDASFTSGDVIVGAGQDLLWGAGGEGISYSAAAIQFSTNTIVNGTLGAGNTAITGTLGVTNGNATFTNSDVTITGTSNAGTGGALSVLDSGSSVILHAQHDGNVGVGTNTADDRLQVVGNADLSGFLEMDDVAILKAEGAGTSIAIGQGAGPGDFSAVGANQIIIGAGVAPFADGTANHLNIGNAVQADVNTGNVRVGETSAVNPTTITRSFEVTGSAYVSGATELNTSLDVNGNSQLDGTLDVEGTTTLDGDVAATDGMLEIIDDVDINGTLEANDYTWAGNDFTPATCASGKFNRWSGTAWVCEDDTAGSSGSGGVEDLNDLDDVVITSADTDDCLQFNGTNWVDVACSSITGSGVFEVIGAVGSEVVRQKASAAPLATSDFVFGSATLDNVDAGTDDDARMFFNKGKAAFRVGSTLGTSWDDGVVGNNSMAWGRNSEASNNRSTAFGTNTTSSGVNSTAWGNVTTAAGSGSTAFGREAMAQGQESVAIGLLGDTQAADPRVTADRSFAIFMGAAADAQSGVNVTVPDTFALLGGTMVIDPNQPATQLSASIGGEENLEFDVEGDVGAINYCDQNGDNCFQAADISGNSAGLWEPDGTNDYIEYDDSLGGVRIGKVTGQPAPATDWALNVGGSIVSTAHRVGVGTPAPSTGGAEAAGGDLELHVVGDVGASQYCDEDGDNCFTVSDVTGSMIGVFERNGTVIRSNTASGAVLATDDFVFGASTLDYDGSEANRMFFDKDKAAFRAGGATTSWNEGSIGNYSFAGGGFTTASGSHSLAFGQNTIAEGSYSFAHGLFARALGNQSFALGNYVRATGADSVALGKMVFAGSGAADATGTASMAFGLQSALVLSPPTVTGLRSSVFYFDGGVANANSGHNFTENDKFAIIGGQFQIDNQSSTANKGCIQYNSASSKLEFSHDCSIGVPVFQQFGTADAAGNDTEIQFNDGGENLGADAEFTYNKTTDTLTVDGIINVTNKINITGQAGNTPNFAAISDLSDVDTTGVNDDECLIYSGGEWGTGDCNAGAAASIFEVTGGAGSEVVSTVDANAPYATADFVFGGSALDNQAGADDNSRMFFDKSRNAFRVGYSKTTEWDNGSVGLDSMAWGGTYGMDGVGTETPSPIASGQNSTAWGLGTTASGVASTAWGGRFSGPEGYIGGTASGTGSTAWGRGTVAEGTISTALGGHAHAEGDASIAIGLQSSNSPHATIPKVSGDRSMVLFIDAGSTTNNAYDFDESNKFAVIGGEFQIDDVGSSANKGCIKYNSATTKLQFSHDCSIGVPVFNDFAAGGSGVFEVTGGAGSEVVRQVAASAPLATADFVFGSSQLNDTGNADDEERVFFNKGKAAFRAGRAVVGEWDDGVVGDSSVAFGNGTVASGVGSFAGGFATIPGTGTIVSSGNSSFAFGSGDGQLSATNTASIAMGFTIDDTSDGFLTSSGAGSVALGHAGGRSTIIASNSGSMAWGYAISGAGSSRIESSGLGSTAFGSDVIASGDYSVGIGLSGTPTANHPTVSANGSFGIFMGDQTSVDIATTSVMSLLGGRMIINPDGTSASPAVPATGFALDVVGRAKIYDTVGNIFISGGNTTATGTNNIVLGGTDSTKLSGEDLSTGYQNILIGSGAGGRVTAGYNNVMLGYQAGAQSVGHRDNVYIGMRAGRFQAPAGVAPNNVAIGSNALLGTSGNGDAEQNVAIGFSTGSNAEDADKNILIGYDIDLPTADTDEYLNIGGILFGDIGITSTDPKIGAHKYCDENLANCFEASAVGAGGGVFEVTGGAGSEVIRQVAASAPYASADFLFGAPTLNDDSTNTKRMFFDKSLAAFRAGDTEGSDIWDDTEIGDGSVAFGYSNKSSGATSMSWGNDNTASETSATAWGTQNQATANSATAWGGQTSASGIYSTSMGLQAQSSGYVSLAAGQSARASGDYSVAFGRDVIAGDGTNNGSTGGYGDAPGSYSVAFGLGDASTASLPQISATSAFGVFMGDQQGVDMTQDNTMAIMGGKVGIGTVTPGADLHIYNTAGNFQVEADESSIVNFGLLTKGDGASLYSQAATNGWSWLAFGDTYGSPTLQNDMFLSNYTGASSSIMMYLDSSSKNIAFGIETDPKAKIHVKGGADDQQLVLEAHTTQTNNIMEIWDTGDTAVVTIDNNGTIDFPVNTKAKITGERETANFLDLDSAIHADSMEISAYSSININPGVGANMADSTSVLIGGSDFTFDVGTGRFGMGTISPATNMHLYAAGGGGIIVEAAEARIATLDFLTKGDATKLVGHADTNGWNFRAFGNSYLAGVANQDDFQLRYLDGAASSNFMFFEHDTGHMGFGNNISPNVEVDVAGSIEYTGTIADVSDRRLKKDIKPLDERGSMLDKINAVETYSFVMKDDEEGRTEFGVMAQEIQPIFPELVNIADDEMGTMSVNYMGLIGPMIEATKELRTENIELRTELQSLRAELQSERADIQDSLKTLTKQVELLNKTAGQNVNKAGFDLNWLMALLTLFSLSGLFIVVTRKRG